MFAHATSESMVGVSGVSWTVASGSPSSGRAGGAGVTTASTLAAYAPSVDRTNVSSPAADTARNSSDADPPIAPDVAAQMTYSMPSRSKIRWYASRCARYERSSPASSTSKE